MGDFDFEELDRVINEIAGDAKSDDKARSMAKSTEAESKVSDASDNQQSTESQHDVHSSQDADTDNSNDNNEVADDALRSHRAMDVVSSGAAVVTTDPADAHAMVMARREKRAEEIRKRLAAERKARAEAAEEKKRAAHAAEQQAKEERIKEAERAEAAQVEAEKRAKEAAELAEHLEKEAEARRSRDEQRQHMANRRSVHYSQPRNDINPRRALSQPRPVEETDLDLSVPADDDEPYTSPFLDGVQVTKKPIGSNMVSTAEQSELSEQPDDASGGANNDNAIDNNHDNYDGINHYDADRTDTSDTLTADDEIDVKPDDFAVPTELPVVRSSTETTKSEDAVVDSMMNRMRERREQRENTVPRPSTTAPAVHLDSTVGNDLEVRDNAADRAERIDESRYAMANVPTYDEYLNTKRHHNWGWVILFVIILAAISAAAVYLYLNNFFV